MKQLDGGVTAPKGFLAAGIAAGVKRQGKDIAVIYSETPATAAGVFTTNVVKAAPVLWSQQRLRNSQGQSVSLAHSDSHGKNTDQVELHGKSQNHRPRIQGIVVNSGNANACTGSIGVEHTEKMCQAAASSLQLDVEAILAASTGVIGVPLPIDVVTEGVAKACLELGSSRFASRAAAEAIMTTDTRPKEVAVELEIDGCKVVIGGMSKGSGMIHPNMATMLAFVTTDAEVDPEVFQEMLRTAAKDTFNMISVDGDTSTNDTVFGLANGAAGNRPIDTHHPEYMVFYEALQYVCTSLAKQIVRDGEGATKLLEVQLSGAANKDAAQKLVQSVLTSSLVKTAFFGADANWGRILAAMGYAGVDFNPNDVTISFQSAAGRVHLMIDGQPQAFDEDLAKEILSEPEIIVHIELEGCRDVKATGWGCDLSYEYVRINGDYRS